MPVCYPRHARRWSAPETDKLFQLREHDKFSWLEISTTLGRTVHSCQFRFAYVKKIRKDTEKKVTKVVKNPVVKTPFTLKASNKSGLVSLFVNKTKFQVPKGTILEFPFVKISV